MAFTSFQDLFNQAANRLNLNIQLTASLICQHTAEYLAANFRHHRSVNVKSYKNETLTCEASDQIVAQELNGQRLKLINHLNQLHPNQQTSKVIIRIISDPVDTL